MNRPRHPEFDRYWAEHQSLVFWWSCRIAKRLGGHWREYLADLTLRFNRCLHAFDPAAGVKFSSFFGGRILSEFTREARKTLQSLPGTFDPPSVAGEDNETSRRFDDVWSVAEQVLPARSLEIVERRFLQNETLASIGDRLSLTRERIRQLEGEALAAIRHALMSPPPN